MKNIIIFSALLTMMFMAICEASTGLPPVQAVEHVDLSRYVGMWYEIAYYPNRFQEGCQDSTATFSLRNDGEIDVLNSCRDKQDGTLHHANGRGWIIDSTSNARLKFSFLWPFSSEYLIIDQGKEYEYAVIATPDRKRLWIIARVPALGTDIFESIVQRIEKQGFQRDILMKTGRSKNTQPDVAAQSK